MSEGADFAERAGVNEFGNVLARRPPTGGADRAHRLRAAHLGRDQVPQPAEPLDRRDLLGDGVGCEHMLSW